MRSRQAGMNYLPPSVVADLTALVMGSLGSGQSYFDRWPPGLPVGWPGCAGIFFLGLPFGQPPILAFRRAAAALAGLVARPACAASTPPMSAPHLGHFRVLIPRHYRRCPSVRHVCLRRLSGAGRSGATTTHRDLALILYLTVQFAARNGQNRGSVKLTNGRLMH